MNPRLRVLQMLVLGSLALQVAPSPVDMDGRRHHGHHHSQHRPQLIQKCGSQLSDLISEVCRGIGYNDHNSAPSSAGASTSFHSGPGIVEECCQRMCHLSVLKSYCKKSTTPTSASTSSTASAEYSDERLSDVDEAHQTNHIRPIASDNDNSLKQHGEVSPKLREFRPARRDAPRPHGLEGCFVGQNTAELDRRLKEQRPFAVGTIPRIYTNTPISVHHSHRPRHNSVK